MSGVRGSGRSVLVSPVLTLLGGDAPEGMVCGVDGVCAPGDPQRSEASESEASSTDEAN